MAAATLHKYQNAQSTSQTTCPQIFWQIMKQRYAAVKGADVYSTEDYMKFR